MQIEKAASNMVIDNRTLPCSSPRNKTQMVLVSARLSIEASLDSTQERNLMTQALGPFGFRIIVSLLY